jgi:DNA-binding HxlR family transcriptional regulator
MSSTYGEYCPIAVGAEIFADRWTPLVLRELIVGCRRFNEIHRGIPKINRTLLTQRLRSLERRGVIERTTRGGAVEYELTEAGRELQPVLWMLGQWAAKWSFGDPEDNQLEVGWLVWRLHQHVLVDKLPADRTVVEFVVSGPGGGNSWLVLDRGSSTACRIDPGYDVDMVVHGDNRALHEWLVGKTSFRKIQNSGAVRMIGPSRLTRAFSTWFDHSMFEEGLSAGRRMRQTAVASSA